jgi:hypothetical protein
LILPTYHSRLEHWEETRRHVDQRIDVPSACFKQQHLDRWAGGRAVGQGTDELKKTILRVGLEIGIFLCD